MPTPSVIVFDLGKVLLDFDYSIAGRRIAAQAAASATDVQQFLDHSPLLYRFETGLMTQRDFFEEVRQKTGFRGSFKDFAGFFADIFWEIPPMVELHARLRRQGFPTYIFSNTNDLAMEHINRHFAFMKDFNAHILSYEVGAMKPDARIYQTLEEISGKRGREILYLDDRSENVEAGAARGWQVILQESPESSRAAMKKLGLPV